MKKKELTEKIAEVLQLPGSKADFAFHNFLIKLGSYLKDNEALKIPELGVFQLKKEPVIRGEAVQKAGNDVIIFIPFPKAGEKKDSSLYLSFNIPSEISTAMEDEASSFVPSVDNPLIPIGEDIKQEENTGSGELENKIEELVKNSEKLEDFEIWKEYPRVVDEGERDEIDDLAGIDIRKSGIIEDDLESDLEETEKEDVDWNWSKDLEEELLEEEVVPDENQEEVSPMPEIDEEKLEKKMEEITSESEAEMKDSSDLTNVEEQMSLTGEQDSEEHEEASEEEDPFKILENTIIEESDELPEEDIDKIVNADETNEAEGTTEVKETAETEKPLPKIEAQPLHKETAESETPEKKSFFAKYKYYFMTAGMIIVLYWLFAPGNDEPVKEFVKEDTTTQQALSKDKENVVASFDEDKTGTQESTVKVDNEKQTNEKQTKEETEAKKADKFRADLRSAKELKVDKKIPQRSSKVRTDSKYKEIKNEKSVGDNIYYADNQYMIQISSWRNNYVAQREAEKLVKKGYDAFVIKAYVPKFKRTYYRVRIGGFSSKQEALKFAKKNL